MEEIIIDGVNVAGCEFLRKCVIPDNEGCKIDDSLCCDVGNCYYKQLQKEKQKNEKLQKQYNCYACGCCNGKEDYINLEKHHLGLRKQFDKYYQAIQKIKKLSTVNVSIENFVKIQKVILEAENE